MFFYTEALINEIVPDRPDPEAAKALQEILGGRFGEMRTMMQFFFQSTNFRGKGKPYRDLLRGIFIEEISHVELVMMTINKLLENSGIPPKGDGNPTTPLEEGLGGGIIYQYIVGGQTSMPVDCSGNPFNGQWIYDSGNLITNLLDNLVLESTGRLEKCRIYEMSANKSLRETLAFLIVRDSMHQRAFAKALETLGVQWGKVLPIPEIDITQYPECQKFMDRGWHTTQFNLRMDPHLMADILMGAAPGRSGGGVLSVSNPPPGFPYPPSAAVPAEFAPGIPLEVAQAQPMTQQ